jgi:transaldolase
MNPGIARFGPKKRLWLDNITRSLLRTDVLWRYVDELSGVTSNPTIFDHAMAKRC